MKPGINPRPATRQAQVQAHLNTQLRDAAGPISHQQQRRIKATLRSEHMPLLRTPTATPAAPTAPAPTLTVTTIALTASEPALTVFFVLIERSEFFLHFVYLFYLN